MGVGQRELLPSLAASAAVVAADGALCVEDMVTLSCVEIRTLCLMLCYYSTRYILSFMEYKVFVELIKKQRKLTDANVLTNHQIKAITKTIIF